MMLVAPILTTLMILNSEDTALRETVPVSKDLRLDETLVLPI